MNAKIYASLFRRRDKLAFLAYFIFCLFVSVALTRSHRQDKTENEFLFLILCPAFGLGSLLIEICHRPLRLPTTVLLPGIQHVLFRYYLGLIFIVILVWGSVLHSLNPLIPWVGALGLSGGFSTLPVYFMWGQPRQRGSLPLAGLIWGVIIGVNLPAIATSGLARPILAHAWLAGTAGWILLMINLWLARKQRPPSLLLRHLMARNPSTGVGGRLVSWWQGISGRTGNTATPKWNYAPRRNSLFRQIQAAFQENPAGFWMNIAGCSLVILLHPWAAQQSAGYPLAWYRVIFGPVHSERTAGSIFTLIIALAASSLGPGLLRTSQFYPISRRQRFTVAFTASAVGFSCNFLTIVGGSVLAGWLVGRWAGLPLPVEPAMTFVIKMAMVVPFMPLMRWGALRLELRQNPVELFLFIAFVAILVIIGQSIVLLWGLHAGIAICIGSIIVSQFEYYSALRRFYCRGDLLQRGSPSSVSGTV